MSFNAFQVRQFWEHTFNCSFNPADWSKDEEVLCTGEEDIRQAEIEFLDISNLRPEYNVYKTVYALAHALEAMQQYESRKGSFNGYTCASFQTLKPWQVRYQLILQTDDE